MSDLILKCEGVGKRYRDGSLDVQVLRGLDLEIHAGESTGIIGSSGSGKSTLLHILGGLDMPSEGRVLLMNEDLRTLSQRQLGTLRNRYLGFVYQFHHLLPEFSALENVMMPLLIGKKNREEAAEAAMEAFGVETMRVCPWALREGLILKRIEHLAEGTGTPVNPKTLLGE